MNIHRLTAVMIAAAVTALPIVSQEALKSTEEEYYDFLSIQGLAERPTLNYRTLSDSEWKLTGEAAEGNHVWAENNLGTRFTLWQAAHPSDNWFTRGIDQGITMKVYGPEWFNSFNTAAPYGQNDGALWQGRGYNTSLTGGIRFEAYGFEATFKPQLSFSQNMAFDIMPSNYDSEYGYFWGYSKNVGVDAPQRFGDKPFFTFDWGDTEIRWSWHTFTLGFGTQSIWLGPAYLNPILHSNNAASYPKFDIGLRKTPVTIPGLGWYIGDIEGRIWTGYLSESDYFDNDDSNNHNMIHGLALAYSPSFLPGLTLSANRVCLVKWDWANLKYIWPVAENTHIGEKGAGEDQKMSLAADWIIKSVGIHLYSEIGIDDFFQGGFLAGFIRYPFDSMTITAGIEKSVIFNEKYSGKIIFEYTNAELPRNKIGSHQSYAFNMHHQIRQGYTNNGQFIGTHLGNGGNAQILQFILYYPKGNTAFTIMRENPDNSYMYRQGKNLNNLYKAIFLILVDTRYWLTPSININGALGYNYIMNPFYDARTDISAKHNIIIQIGLKYNI